MVTEPAPPTAPQQPQLQIPERPSLAPGVQLKGAMTESAFRDPPWLIDRDGTFVMVPKLLYEVAANANGEREHAQIAEAVTEATRRGVTSEHIQILVARLMIMGVIAGPDGRLAVPATSLEQARSVLGLNLKVHLLSP